MTESTDLQRLENWFSHWVEDPGRVRQLAAATIKYGYQQARLKGFYTTVSPTGRLWPFRCFSP